MLRLFVRLGIGFFAVAIVAPLLARVAAYQGDGVSWRLASLARTGLAPDPAIAREAVIQVYAARAFGWRGAVAAHSWIVVKPANAAAYRRFEVVSWGGGRVVRVNRAPPDARWYGAEPEVLTEVRGALAERLISRIERAVGTYPWPDAYRAFPGPNSNSFVAHVARSVPELGVNLPPTAIGKDYKTLPTLIGRPPSGRGVQLSLYGIAGFILSPVEGIEINLFGFGAGLDADPLALRLPGWGRVGWTSRALASDRTCPSS